MPLGVEHRTIEPTSTGSSKVSQPSMPLGVEHRPPKTKITAKDSESTFDAVRR